MRNTDGQEINRLLCARDLLGIKVRSRYDEDLGKPAKLSIMNTKTWKAIGNTSLPIAPVDQEWDGRKARERIFRWAGWDKLTPSKRAWMGFLVVDQECPGEQTAYRLPFTDVINGELMAVPCAIDAIARALSREHNELGLPPDVVEQVRRKLGLYYRKMKAIPPWMLGDRS